MIGLSAPLPISLVRVRSLDRVTVKAKGLDWVMESVRVRGWATAMD